jgi:hypothetical protein
LASLSRLAAAVRVTRPAVEWDTTRANLDSPEPSPIVGAAAQAIDARRGHAVDRERPIVFCDIDRAVDPRERVVVAIAVDVSRRRSSTSPFTFSPRPANALTRRPSQTPISRERLSAFGTEWLA